MSLGCGARSRFVQFRSSETTCAPGYCSLMTAAESPEAAPMSRTVNVSAGRATLAISFRSEECPPKLRLIRTRSARFGRAASGGMWSSTSGSMTLLLKSTTVREHIKLDSLTQHTGLDQQTGWIEVICGPMFSGKSEELIRRLRRARIARRKVAVFKPALDNRFSDTEIVTHAATRMGSDAVDSARDILQKLDWTSHVIGIDEANFFGAELIDVATELA